MTSIKEPTIILNDDINAIKNPNSLAYFLNDLRKSINGFEQVWLKSYQEKPGYFNLEMDEGNAGLWVESFNFYYLDPQDSYTDDIKEDDKDRPTDLGSDVNTRDNPRSLVSFIADLHNAADSFEANWLNEHQKNPDIYPLELPGDNLGFWFECFIDHLNDTLIAEDDLTPGA